MTKYLNENDITSATEAFQIFSRTVWELVEAGRGDSIGTVKEVHADGTVTVKFNVPNRPSPFGNVQEHGGYAYPYNCRCDFQAPDCA